MDLSAFLSQTQSQFSKKFKESNAKPELAQDCKAVTGLIVDDPLMEFVLDRRFIPFGRAILTYGKKGNSKTTLFYDFAKRFQRAGGIAYLLETERALDLDYAKKQGVDLSRFLVEHPESLEQALTKVITIIENLDAIPGYSEGKVPVLIGFDSIAGACPEYEQDAGIVIGETRVGEHARICSAFYRRIEGLLANENATFMALNQQKVKIGGFQPAGAGEDGPEALIGGEAQFYHSSYHFKMVRTKDLTKKDTHSDAERKVGSRHLITAKRNKLGREGNKQCVEFDLYIDGGIDWFSPLIRHLGKNGYKELIKDNGRGMYTWLKPDCKVTIKDAEGNVIDQGIIPTDKPFREIEMGKLVQSSADAKEHIRTAFGIPPLPSVQEIELAEAEKKEKRKTKKKDSKDKEL